MTDKFLTELDEALRHLGVLRELSKQAFPDFPLSAKEDALIKAATLLRDLYPILVQLCEARKGATEGEWELWDGSSWRRFGIKGTTQPFIYPYNDRHDNHPDIRILQEDGHFIALSANLTTQIQKILEGK